MRGRSFLRPSTITATYVAVGAVWIFFSDRLVARLPGASSVADLTQFQTAKGLLFVVATATMIYWLMRMQAGQEERVQSKLREKDQRYREIFERSGAVMLLLDAATGQVVDANTAAERFYGWPRDTLLGKSLASLRADGSSAAAELELARAGRRSRFDCRHRIATGGIRDVELNVSPVEVVGPPMLLAIVQDVTQRRLAEAALAASERKYRTLMNDASDAIFILDSTGILEDVNVRACELLRMTPEELRGRHASALMDPVDLERRPLRLEDLHRGHTVILERRLVRSDGQIVPVELSAKALDGGRIQAIVRDITERRRLEEHLRQAQKMEAIGQLTGGIAHDLNNMLTVVLANAQLLDHALPDDRADLRGDLNELRHAAQRGAAMIRKLLGFSRREPLTRVALDVAELVRGFRETLARLLPAHIEIEVCADAPVPVLADGGSIEQILMNLSTNARDAMPEGGTIRIETRRVEVEAGSVVGLERGGAYGLLVVRDTGTGMSEDVVARIFEPFYTTKELGKGTGLGMAMVYGLVKQQEGAVHIDTAPGRGTEVRVYLPAAERVEPAAAPLPPGEWPRGDETILLVEDEAPVRRAAARVLGGLGYAVVEAADGVEALEAIDRLGAGIHLVLSDLVMPRLGGRALYDAIRRDGREVPFLFSTGYDGGELHDLGVPAAQVIRKPWVAGELATRVREALDGTGREAAYPSPSPVARS